MIRDNREIDKFGHTFRAKYCAFQPILWMNNSITNTAKPYPHNVLQWSSTLDVYIRESMHFWIVLNTSYRCCDTETEFPEGKSVKIFRNAGVANSSDSHTEMTPRSIQNIWSDTIIWRYFEPTPGFTRHYLGMTPLILTSNPPNPINKIKDNMMLYRVIIFDDIHRYWRGLLMSKH